MDTGSILASLATYWMKGIYTTILVGIALLCFEETYRIWFDRTPVLAPYDDVEGGAIKPEHGQSFANILVHRPHLLRNMLAQQGSSRAGRSKSSGWDA